MAETSDQFEGLLLSDVNLDPVANAVTNGAGRPSIRLESAPYGQPLQLALDDQHRIWERDWDFAVLWTSPEGVLPAFRSATEHRVPDEDELAADAESFLVAVRALAARVPRLLVPTWSYPRTSRNLGPVDLQPGGITRSLLLLNLALLRGLDRIPHALPINSDLWTRQRAVYSAKYWHAAKVPFGLDIALEAAEQVRSAVRSLVRPGIKLAIVDLDDTLWGGLVGEVDSHDLQLGGHDPVGEAFVDFQRALKSLTRRGIALGIVSKNDEHRALAAIDSHPEMVLARNDFAAWRINFEDKAANVAAIAEEVNVGLDAVMFIDDSPFERGRVREALPEVLVPDWPPEVFDYVAMLDSIPQLDRVTTTSEDRARASMYADERERRQVQANAADLASWRAGLGLEVEFEELSATTLPRTAQLLNKTNQMNLATRRMSPTELLDWASRPDCSVWALRARDRFGDYGLVGVLGLSISDEVAQVRDFVLSCRAMGRGVEEAILAIAARVAGRSGAQRIELVYVETQRNQPCLRFLADSFLSDTGAAVFAANIEEVPEDPSVVIRDASPSS